MITGMLSEYCFYVISDGGLSEKLRPLLQFLLHLAGTGPHKERVHILGQDTAKLPIIFPDKVQY